MTMGPEIHHIGDLSQSGAAGQKGQVAKALENLAWVADPKNDIWSHGWHID